MYWPRQAVSVVQSTDSSPLVFGSYDANYFVRRRRATPLTGVAKTLLEALQYSAKPNSQTPGVCGTCSKSISRFANFIAATTRIIDNWQAIVVSRYGQQSLSETRGETRKSRINNFSRLSLEEKVHQPILQNSEIANIYI